MSQSPIKSQSQIKPQLHLIQNKLSLATFERQFLRLVADNDSLLFLNDSVLTLLEKEFSSENFEQLTRKVTLYAIDEHLQSRNITQFTHHIKTIRFQDFVEQSQSCSKTVSW